MKKNRPATKISVLANESNRQTLTDILLQETTSFGVRYYKVGRTVLDREIKSVKTSWGLIKIKVGKLNGKVVQVSPEYEDCKKTAVKRKTSVKIIFEEAQFQARKLLC